MWINGPTPVFFTLGFVLHGHTFRPCENQFHASCICIGPPFMTQLYRHTWGIAYPTSMWCFPFICEVCTVCTILGCKLMDTLQTMHSSASNGCT